MTVRLSTALLLLAVVGLSSLGRRALEAPWLAGLTLALAFTAVHAFYWTDLRMRAPLTPVLAICAALGAQRIAGRGKRVDR